MGGNQCSPIGGDYISPARKQKDDSRAWYILFVLELDDLAPGGKHVSSNRGELFLIKFNLLILVIFSCFQNQCIFTVVRKHRRTFPWKHSCWTWKGWNVSTSQIFLKKFERNSKHRIRHLCERLNVPNAMSNRNTSPGNSNQIRNLWIHSYNAVLVVFD